MTIADDPAAIVRAFDAGVPFYFCDKASVPFVTWRAATRLEGMAEGSAARPPSAVEWARACQGVTVGAIRAFVLVAEHASFARAGDILIMDSSSIGKQVRRLERDLGVVLLSRSTRRVDLTDAGRVCLPWAIRIVDAADEMSRAAKGSTRTGRRAGEEVIDLTETGSSRPRNSEVQRTLGTGSPPVDSS